MAGTASPGAKSARFARVRLLVVAALVAGAVLALTPEGVLAAPPRPVVLGADPANPAAPDAPAAPAVALVEVFVREGPYVDAPVVISVGPGETVYIAAGPVRSEGFTWAYVVVLRGSVRYEGFCATEFLATRGAVTPLPTRTPARPSTSVPTPTRAPTRAATSRPPTTAQPTAAQPTVAPPTATRSARPQATLVPKPTATPTPLPRVQMRVTTMSGLRLREGPGEEYPVLHVAPYLASMETTGRDATVNGILWLEVIYKGDTVWGGAGFMEPATP